MSISFQAIRDFDKAKNKALITEILNILRPERTELMSFYDIKSLLKPQAEIYRGMKAVSLDRIVGSEGRYLDFNKAFLPKKEHLRERWVRVDTAYHNDINLPPIRLYKIGEVYFVRDGNHRVSVARAQKSAMIDAEVVELTTRIPFTADMTHNDLITAVVAFERERVLNETGLDKMIDMESVGFSTPGRYDEILQHILGHKYFINQQQSEEIPFSDAALSWYENLYKPILELIRDMDILRYFPGRTEGDLYLWIVKHWDSLKRRFGQEFPLELAAREYMETYGRGLFERFLIKLKRLLNYRTK
jgi:hypothetical protein